MFEKLRGCHEWIELRMKRCARSRTEIESELASRVDQRIFRWFGHMERMDEDRMARRVVMASTG